MKQYAMTSKLSVHMDRPLLSAAAKVTLGGALVLVTGILIGNA
ncbi:hypothetical protein [Methylobacterium fujisawaense]|jgi:hypothetical protein